MKSKIWWMVLFCVTVVSAGENKLTGNARWDLITSHDSTITTTSTVIVQTSPNKIHPLVNGLYSFVVPGAGQYNTERYTKAVIFFTAEVATVAAILIYTSKGNSKTNEFQRYAEAHWSAERYARYIAKYGVVDYGPQLISSFNNYDEIKNNNFTQINEWERGLHKEGFSHALPAFGDQQYYELIGKYDQYKFGWDEYEVDGISWKTNGGIPPSDKNLYASYIPLQMKNYAVERGRANDFFYTAKFATAMVVLNHVLSAFDGMLSARAFNSEITSNIGMKLQQYGDRQELVTQLDVKFGF